jgi:hypothetical protein
VSEYDYMIAISHGGLYANQYSSREGTSIDITYSRPRLGHLLSKCFAKQPLQAQVGALYISV